MKLVMLAEAKRYVMVAWDTVVDQKLTSTFLGVATAVMQLVLNSVQIDIFIFMGLMLLIFFNTLSGVRLAKKAKVFELKHLKESVVSKLMGYLLLLTGLSVFVIILFVASLRDDTRLFSDYWFNLPVLLVMVFLSSVEFKSMLDNLEELGVNVPGFVKNLPKKVQDKIDDMVDK